MRASGQANAASQALSCAVVTLIMRQPQGASRVSLSFPVCR
jgi:hypothetical protein